jgi:hypothetical protein
MCTDSWGLQTQLVSCTIVIIAADYNTEKYKVLAVIFLPRLASLRGQSLPGTRNIRESGLIKDQKSCKVNSWILSIIREQLRVPLFKAPLLFC